jgi:hypothetical protein
MWKLGERVRQVPFPVSPAPDAPRSFTVSGETARPDSSPINPGRKSYSTNQITFEKTMGIRDKNDCIFPVPEGADWRDALTLNEFYAAFALAGILASRPLITPEAICRAALDFADLMIEESMKR